MKRLQPQEFFNQALDILKGTGLEPVILTENLQKFDPSAKQPWNKPIQILPMGYVRCKKGDFIVDQESGRSIKGIFKDSGIDMVIDYEHQSLTGNKAPAAGWITEIYTKDDGIYGTVEWTEDAKGHLKRKEYRYHSPVIGIRKRDRKAMHVHSLALTNTPAIKDMTAIANKFEILINSTEEPMNGFIQKLISFLSLPAKDVKEETTNELNQTITSLKDSKAGDLQANKKLANLGETILKWYKTTTDERAGAVPLKDIAEELGLEGNVDFLTIKSSIQALKAPASSAEDLSQQVVALKSEVSTMKADKVIELALKDGKTSPEEVEKWGRELAKNNPEQFEKIVLSRPQGSVIPVQEISSRIPDKDSRLVADEVQIQINKQLGISAEDFKKYGPQVKSEI